MQLNRTLTQKGNVDIITYTHMGNIACTIVVVFDSYRRSIINLCVTNVSVPPTRLAVLVRNACATWTVLPEVSKDDIDSLFTPESEF